MQVDIITVLEKLFAVYNVHVNVIKKPYQYTDFYDTRIRKILRKDFDINKEIKQFIKNIPMNTLQNVKEFMGIQYSIFLIPNSLDCVIIGPYRYGKFYSFDENLFTSLNISQENIDLIKEYYLDIPFVDESLITVNLEAIISTIYPQDKFEIKHYIENQPNDIVPQSISFEKKEKSIEQRMSSIEYRYKVENEVFNAISKGDATSATILMKKMISPDFANRFILNLRSQKNSLIIFNTLLRKAIEQGNVHPYYVDEISSKYSKIIELVSNEKEFLDIQLSMINDYCDYVHKYSHDQYSSLIQKAIQYININVSKEISLQEISDYLNTNPSYLSKQFHLETGITLINYIHNQKIKQAMYLLRNTQQSISNIAHQVGFYDLNYFSRIFKKQVGITPSNYRKSSMLK